MDDYETMVKLVVPQNNFIAYELVNIGDEYYKPYGISYIDCFESQTLSMDDYETMVKLVVPQNNFIAYELVNIGDEYYKPYGISYIDCFESQDY